MCHMQPHFRGIPGQHISCSCQSSSSSYAKNAPSNSHTRKVDCSKKYLSIRTIHKHIIDHRVAVISTIHQVLLNTFICSFGRKRYTIRETYDVINNRFSHLNHSGVLPHLVSIRKFYLCKWMIHQSAHDFFKHPIDATAANQWCDAKNKAKMFIIQCAPQVKQKKT
jgi:hypothetical protein